MFSFVLLSGTFGVTQKVKARTLRGRRPGHFFPDVGMPLPSLDVPCGRCKRENYGHTTASETLPTEVRHLSVDDVRIRPVDAASPSSFALIHAYPRSSHTS
jgi:hypothetical protein